MVHLIRLRPLMLCAAVGLALIPATACSSSGSGHKAPPPAPSLSATPTPSASDEADRTAVLEVYRRYWEEQVKAYAQGTAEGTDLSKFAADPALGKTRIQMYKNRQQDIVFKGAPKNNPTVSAIDVIASPKTATITDCLDISGWTPVNDKTGATLSVTNPQPRYLVTVSARTVGSSWMITDFSSDKSRPC